MPLILLFLIFNASLIFADTVKGLQLIHEGKLREGYLNLESSFHKTESQDEKGRLAYLLAFGTGTGTSQVYYARYALKYHKGLSDTEQLKLKILTADSFMDYGEFTKAFELYQETLKTPGPHKSYVQYQLGYYYLNTQKPQNAFSQWSSLLTTDLKDKAMKSIGRYWEKMNFLGDVKQLKTNPSFMEGFSVSVDEREEELTLQDLNKFKEKKSGPEMLTLLIEKNTLFIKKPCEFAKWYDVKLGLNNDLIFPILKKCYDTDKNMADRITQMASSVAATQEEKLFVITLYKEQGIKRKACEWASLENFHTHVFTLCEESSDEMAHSLTEVLKEGDKNLLSLGRVIKSAGRLPLDQRKKLKSIIGETQYAREFFDRPDYFISEAKALGFSDETKLLFSVFHRFSEHQKVFEKDLQSSEAKELQDYLSRGIPVKTTSCGFNNEDLRRIVIEAKLSSGNFGPDDQSCSSQLISQDEGLSFLASSLIIARAKRVRLDSGAILSSEILNNNEISSIRPLEGNFGKEINLYLKVQNFKTKNIASSSDLLSELRKLKQLRSEIMTRKWLSVKVSEKVSENYNALLDEFVSRNAASMEKLKLASQVSAFIKELRLA